MAKRVYKPDDAHHCAYINLALSVVKNGVAHELTSRVRTGEGFDQRQAIAMRRLQLKAMKFQEKK